MSRLNKSKKAQDTLSQVEKDGSVAVPLSLPMFECLGLVELDPLNSESFFFDGLKLLMSKLDEKFDGQPEELLNHSNQSVGKVAFIDLNDKVEDSFVNLGEEIYRDIDYDTVVVRTNNNWFDKGYDPTLLTKAGNYKLVSVIAVEEPTSSEVINHREEIHPDQAKCSNYSFIGDKLFYLGGQDRLVVSDENTVECGGELHTFTKEDFLKAHLFSAKVLVYKREKVMSEHFLVKNKEREERVLADVNKTGFYKKAGKTVRRN